MHELSIAMSIIDMVQEESVRLGGRRVEAVHLRIGRLAGIVPDALTMSYHLACDDTPLAGSRLVIEDVPVVVNCPACEARRGVRSLQDMRCDSCGAPADDVVEGRELLVTFLEVIP